MFPVCRTLGSFHGKKMVECCYKRSPPACDRAMPPHPGAFQPRMPSPPDQRALAFLCLFSCAMQGCGYSLVLFHFESPLLLLLLIPWQDFCSTVQAMVRKTQQQKTKMPWHAMMQLDVLLLSFEEKGDATIFLSSDHLSLTLSLPPSLCVCVCGSESA
ncbi:uncharacterized protein [Triticum aestivum]|uniref:uncharacterized protein isoform X2 n=1 Tax=Triticum aestivum TaxID=4565 RepID=UPI001ABBF894|nr:uncharacterized protein LOC109775002 isoform X2 [Aegilops tauschii subsp. strangulata]XP_044418749.1 uncharacterized protein LOC123143816 isoform X2 [Triticum aestivum]